ncbi:hypothetical protein BGZ65_002260 [Modicella reniformis]|uniref:Uncharacterized protein n=1 Tax=Modicella reniformis TaxID=1440133 RepID=A0A9P6SML4_9FUNG|nr:hypothetical protein BGZ65_002260 [Modicella reniformis]
MRNRLAHPPCVLILIESVTPPTLLAHLRLLRLVQSLVIVDEEDLDFLFLIRSEERYLMFLDMLEQLQPPASTMPLPPLDVALMWTVHMLAPYRYHEDLLRNYGPHLLNYAFPLERYVALVDIAHPTTDHEEFNPSKEMWRQLYPEEPFDLDKNDTQRMFEIQCPWCEGTNIMDSSTYIKFRIDGIQIECGCGSQCSLETLSSKRFWDAVEAYRADSSNLLAGSLLSPWTGTPDPEAAQREHCHLFFHPRIQFGLDQASVALNCTWPKVIQAFQDLGPDQYYGVRPTTLARIISSYMSLVEDHLSMDLVAGALRQRDFQKAMMVTGGQAWCQPQVLQRSLDRYKKFMLLARAENRHTAAVGGGGVAGMATMAAGGGTLGAGQPGRHALVPTLDIDLAWHTHMLSPAHYRQFQLLHYGRVLNHDDTVQATSSMTKQDFVRTAELWQDLYQERYSNQPRSGFVLTPGKICAGAMLPPYGVYLVWKNWKSKRKAKKNKKGDKNKGKKVKQQGSEVETTTDLNVGPGRQPSLRIEELDTQDESTQQQQQQGHDKGKGKVASETDTGISPVPLSTESQRDATTSGSGSNATGPNGQASCSSGACIMSPWNEMQDLVPFVDLQPQQQRELRREKMCTNSL